LQKKPLAFSGCEDFMVSHPGISEDIALLSSEPMLICIGHSPVKPLAASPLMGSAAQSNRRSNVRRNFMAGIIAELLYPCTRECVASVAQRTAPAPTDDYGGGAQHLMPAIDPPAK
jgi:hypothetical protein